MADTPQPPHPGGAAAASRAIMPPYVVLQGFLDDATVAGLLAYAVQNKAAFAPTKIKGNTLLPEVRSSSGLRALGAFGALMSGKITTLLPTLTKTLGLEAITPSVIETELVAHGDGAFYKRHIDTRTGDDDRRIIRALSGVYYFHAQPKAFTGGALRLYAIGGSDADFVDIVPEHNSLLAFPAWAPHEVMPVSCPSKRFIDSRFAINCWVYRERKPTPL